MMKRTASSVALNIRQSQGGSFVQRQTSSAGAGRKGSQINTLIVVIVLVVVLALIGGAPSGGAWRAMHEPGGSQPEVVVPSLRTPPPSTLRPGMFVVHQYHQHPTDSLLPGQLER